MNNIYLETLAILLLIAANGFFSLSEFSIIASRRSRLKRLAREGNKSADRALKILLRPESFLATVQIGITFVGIMAGVYGGMTIVNHISPLLAKIPIDSVANSARTISSVIVALLITFFAVVIGELVPKYLALSRPERIASKLSGPIAAFIKISIVPVKILSGSAKLFMRFFGFKYKADRASLTEEEINLIIAEGREKGVFDATEQEMIHSVFDFTDTTARQAMTPRTNIIGIDINDDSEEILKKITSYGFSRFPVYENTLDKITGILYAKDIINILHHSGPIVINDIVRKPLFIPDSMMLNMLLKTLKQKRVHVAIVLDEFGGTAGLITLEDILEEIVGEIHDEFDNDQKEFVKNSDSLAFAAASLRVDELNDQFNTKLPEDGPSTIGGLVFENLGHPAVKGETMTIRDIKFTVLETEGNRLKRLRVEKLLTNQA